LLCGDDVRYDVIKMPFTDKDGYVTKAFQKEKHDTASQYQKNMRIEIGVVAD